MESLFSSIFSSSFFVEALGAVDRQDSINNARICLNFFCFFPDLITLGVSFQQGKSGNEDGCMTKDSSFLLDFPYGFDTLVPYFYCLS